MTEPRFLLLTEVLLLHRDLLRRFGGRDGVRDMGLLRSAVAMPQASFDGEWLHPTLVDMAAAYAFHIAENQPFVDGNKRAGLHAALMFLWRNGVHVRDPERKLIGAMLGLADRSVTKDGIAALLRELALEQ
ncbi:type II toxin-antitoxin system death-on-curing family toxin [Sorangium sp. So ce119]|uniref:type II toxin-antitoxin system death-on-curing family toxin n=1 Tax=Sorangium sp. So ce119 TaxID=3133279 RepID=UPI003F603DB0